MTAPGTGSRLMSASCCLFGTVILATGCAGGGSGGRHQPTTNASPAHRETSAAQLRAAAVKALPPPTDSERPIESNWLRVTASAVLVPIPATTAKRVKFVVACGGEGSFDVLRTTKRPHAGDIPTVECGGKPTEFSFRGGDLTGLALRPYGKTSAVAAYRFTRQQ